MRLRWRLTLCFGPLSAPIVLLAALSVDLSLGNASQLAADQLGGDAHRRVDLNQPAGYTAFIPVVGRLWT